MNERTKTGLEILQVAVVLGVLGDILLRSTPWGLNALLFNVAFVAALVMLLKRHAPRFLTGTTIALFTVQVFFAAMFVWRDSNELKVADTFAILAVLSVLFLPSMKVTRQIAGVFHYVVAFFWSSLNAFFAPFVLLVADIEWKNMPRDGWRKHVFGVARGLVVATPLVLVFGGLFVAADAAYEGWVNRVLNIDPETIFTHVLLFSIFSWLTAGYLRGVLFEPKIVAAAASAAVSIIPTDDHTGSRVDRVRAESGEYPVTLPGDRSVVEHLNVSGSSEDKEAETPPSEGAPAPSAEKKAFEWAKIDNTLLPSTFTLGTVEIGVILGLMNLLFLSFVLVQVPYLFGGMDLVQNTPDFKLAEYARRGFGELVAVSALVLPTLLLGHWLVRKETPAAGTLFRILAGVQIALLFVIMASAVQRLVLLTGNLGYGMTTVRLYPLIFMTWLAVVFVWFGLTVLRGARQYFAWGALWSAFFILGGTHVLNPDEFIMKHNLALMREGREFDPTYVSELSDDALPALYNSFEELNPEHQQIAVKQLARRYCEKLNEFDLRSWNVSRHYASNVLLSNSDFVGELGGCDSPLVKPVHVPD